MSEGHDSIQDAAVALELALMYLKGRIDGSGEVYSKSMAHSAWSNSDLFVHPKVPLLHSVETIGKLQAHICAPYDERPRQEQFLIGYRKEASVVESFRVLEDSSGIDRQHSEKFRSCIHQSPWDAVAAATAHVQSDKDSGSVLWVDFNLLHRESFMESPHEHQRVEACNVDSSSGASLDLFGLDSACERIYASASPGTLVLVATQGVAPPCPSFPPLKNHHTFFHTFAYTGSVAFMHENFTEKEISVGKRQSSGCGD